MVMLLLYFLGVVKMSTSEAAKIKLYSKLSKILHETWDPIGVFGIPSSESEYNAYLPRLDKMLTEGISSKELFDYLFEIETKQMGLEGNAKNIHSVIEKLKLLKYKSD